MSSNPSVCLFFPATQFPFAPIYFVLEVNEPPVQLAVHQPRWVFLHLILAHRNWQAGKLGQWIMMIVKHLSDCLGRARDRKNSDCNEENTPTIISSHPLSKLCFPIFPTSYWKTIEVLRQEEKKKLNFVFKLEKQISVLQKVLRRSKTKNFDT